MVAVVVFGSGLYRVHSYQLPETLDSRSLQVVRAIESLSRIKACSRPPRMFITESLCENMARRLERRPRKDTLAVPRLVTEQAQFTLLRGRYAIKEA